MPFKPITKFHDLEVGLIIRATDQWRYDKDNDINNTLWSQHMRRGVKIRSLDDKDESFYIDTLDGTITENNTTGWSMRYKYIKENCVIEHLITKSIPRFQLIDDEI